MTEKTYEMMWDCEYCGTKKLLGKTHRFCAECGAPQNPARRYFPPDTEKVAVEDHQFVGADVHCPACQEPQSAAVKHCANCGSPIQGGKAASVQAEQVIGPDDRVQPAVGAAPPKSSKAGCIIGAIVLVVVAVVAFFVVNRFWTKAGTYEVTKLTWKRTIEIERYGEFKESGACSDVPKGAKITNRSKAKPVCKTRKTDRGDGTFKEKEECTEPVEQCDYTVERWKTQRSVKEEGGADDKPSWPTTKVSKTNRNCIGCEREGARSEVFTVHLVDTTSKDADTCPFTDVDEWKRFKKGSRWTGETGMLTGGIKCDKLKKAK